MSSAIESHTNPPPKIAPGGIIESHTNPPPTTSPDRDEGGELRNIRPKSSTVSHSSPPPPTSPDREGGERRNTRPNFRNTVLILLAVSRTILAQTPVDVVPVESRAVERTLKLPGEFLPYESVALRSRVPAFVEQVLVDRGSRVKKGQPLVELSAPEMTAQLAEARSKVQVAEAQKGEAEAQLAAARSTADKFEQASATPGAIAGNELVQGRQAVKSAQALVEAREQSVRAAHAGVKALEDLAQYLHVTAPFDGIVTDRLVHPGALARDEPLLMLENISRLRLVIPVPEAQAGEIANVKHVDFTVPAYPGRTFAGNVARSAHMLDVQTRTMAVEADVANGSFALAPGMYPQVSWPVRTGKPSLLVPATSVVTNTERTFVIRVEQTHAEWVTVKRGAAAGDLVEVLGDLHEGDLVVKRGTDELRNGMTVVAKKGAR